MPTNSARNIRRYVLLPTNLMIIDALAEVVIYKLSVIVDPNVRVLAIMAMIAFGFSLVSFVVTPWVERRLRAVHKGTKRGWGILGELALLAALVTGLFLLHYELYVHGPQSLLPVGWRN